MAWYDRIKKFYNQKLWTISMVSDGVSAKKITATQFEEITGVKYEDYLVNPSQYDNV